jgi:cyclic di-GMP phosphodiesterase
MLVSSPILIVDDEPTNLAVLRQILKDEYPLVFARSGAEALTAAVKHRPRLVLLDVDMPDLDGYEVCRRLKADLVTEAIPVIFVSVLTAVGNEEAGFAAGGVDYIMKPVSAPIVRARVRTHLSLIRTSELEKSHRAAIFMLGEAGHYNDTDTGVHIWRMAAYSRALAEALGWSPEAAAMLELAAPMHDTGKIGISDLILRKPGPLNDDEWVVMKTHCDIGYRILSKNDAPLFALAAEVALGHHEKWDGSGYPHGLAGTVIPESARIVAVADVFDALSVKRPYKEAWPPERVLATLDEGAGKHFEPRLIAIFRRIIPTIQALKVHWDARETASVAA